jgi:D-alanyl-D-alanine carboxypeptidase
MIHRELLRSLGIADDYGSCPELALHEEARTLTEVEPNIIGRTQRLAPPTADAWAAMKHAARQDGIELLIVSGYRSVAEQAALIRKKLLTGQRIEDILKVNAAPGYSEHHTGRAIDIATLRSRPLTEEFAATPAFEWLTANAARFAFHMPFGRNNRLGFCYEPWHWSQVDDPSV